MSIAAKTYTFSNALPCGQVNNPYSLATLPTFKKTIQASAKRASYYIRLEGAALVTGAAFSFKKFTSQSEAVLVVSKPKAHTGNGLLCAFLMQ